MERIAKAVIAGNVEAVQRLTEEALEAGRTAQQILDEGLLPGMNYVGTRFKNGDMFIPEVLVSARAMQSAVTVLEPHFGDTRAKMRGTVVLGTVQGDLHDIGKNLVRVMLETAGFDVVDLGIDVSPEAFVEAVRKYQPQIVGMSALLTTTMGMMQKTVQALAEAGVRDQLRVIVGGAPVTAEFTERIGADGYGIDAVAAAELATSLVGA